MTRATAPVIVHLLLPLLSKPVRLRDYLQRMTLRPNPDEQLKHFVQETSTAVAQNGWSRFPLGETRILTSIHDDAGSAPTPDDGVKEK